MFLWVAMVVAPLRATEPQIKETVKIVPLTSVTFTEKIYNLNKTPVKWEYMGDKPAIVYFHADWCVYCKVTSRRLSDLAAEYGGDIYVYSIDVDEESRLADVFRVSNLPHLIFIPMESEPVAIVGAMSKRSFRKGIDQILLGKDDK